MNMNQILSDYGISALPDDTVEAMAYVPFQPYSPKMCKPVLGYENGTMFKSLTKPFYGARCEGKDDD